MPTERLSMRHIREVLRLPYSVGMSQRTAARSLCLAQGTVSKYLNRTRRAGLTWPLPPELDDDVRLENRLYPPPSDLPSDERPRPDWALVHRELRRPNVTLMLLWEEYCDASSDGFSYSWFCGATRNGQSTSSRPCARSISPARSCSSTIPATPWRWLTGSAVRCAPRRSSSPCSAPRTTPTPRPASARACRTGSPRTFGHLPISAAPPGRR